MRSSDKRFTMLLIEAAERPGSRVPKITTLRSVTLSRRATATTVGLTRYSRTSYSVGQQPKQSLTFYSGLIDPLSGPAVVAVVAHELAHAWLNEHEGPEESSARERDADLLAKRWGFGPELSALDHEAYSVNSE